MGPKASVVLNWNRTQDWAEMQVQQASVQLASLRARVGRRRMVVSQRLARKRQGAARRLSRMVTEGRASLGRLARKTASGVEDLKQALVRSPGSTPPGASEDSSIIKSLPSPRSSLGAFKSRPSLEPRGSFS